jgi:hypothetical protein
MIAFLNGCACLDVEKTMVTNAETTMESPNFLARMGHRSSPFLPSTTTTAIVQMVNAPPLSLRDENVSGFFTLGFIISHSCMEFVVG